MKSPLVSLIISVYNGGVFLPDCIKGINNQTFTDYEVVVVDDGSTDKTCDILIDWQKQNDRVRIITRPNAGLTSALNLAISQAHGRYIARQDADDISSPNRIERQAKFLESHKDAVLVSSHCIEFIDLQNLISIYTLPDDPKFILETLRKGENPLFHGSVMMRKEAFERLHEGYRFKFAQDYDLYLRIASFGELRVIPEVLYALRNHPSRTEIQVRELKGRIHKLIMQTNGLVLWDSKSEVIIANYNGKEPLWRVLQENLINTSRPPSKKKIDAQYFISMIGDNLEKNNKITAFSCATKAIGSYPIWWKPWISIPYALIGIVLPRSLVGRWRGRGIASRYRKTCHAASLTEVFVNRNI